MQTPDMTDPAASGSASSFAQKVESLPGGEKVTGAARSAAAYVRDNDVKSMVGDAQQLVKNNPGLALIGAAALGFLIARTLSRE